MSCKDGTSANSMGLQKNWRDHIAYSSRTKPDQSFFQGKTAVGDVKSKNCEYEYFLKKEWQKNQGT